jgi:hypothetical protein
LKYLTLARVDGLWKQEEAERQHRFNRNTTVNTIKTIRMKSNDIHLAAGLAQFRVMPTPQRFSTQRRESSGLT